MTWAARYSATEQPELTIYRDGVEVTRVDVALGAAAVRHNSCTCRTRVWSTWLLEASHDTTLRADIAARVDLRECDRPACALHAIGQGLCVLHGGRDPL